MVLCLEGEKPGGTDQDAVDVGGPPVAVQGEVVVSGVIVAQSRREQMGSECLLAPDSAPIGRIGGTARGRDEKSDDSGDDTGCDDEGDACDDSNEQKSEGDPGPGNTGHEALFRFFLKIIRKERLFYGFLLGHTLRPAFTKLKKSWKNPLKSSGSLTLAAYTAFVGFRVISAGIWAGFSEWRPTGTMI